jgi:hypothetical protein
MGTSPAPALARQAGAPGQGRFRDLQQLLQLLVERLPGRLLPQAAQATSALLEVIFEQHVARTEVE